MSEDPRRQMLRMRVERLLRDVTVLNGVMQNLADHAVELAQEVGIALVPQPQMPAENSSPKPSSSEKGKDS